MIARRFVSSILLLTVVANTWAFARPNSETTVPQEGPSFHLVSLKHETVGSLTRISIESSSAPLYTVFKPTGNLIVVDFPGGDGSQLTPWYAVKSAAVDSIAIRKSQATANASKFFGASIEIKVQGRTSDKSILQGNTLIIEITGEKAAAQEPKKAVTKPGVYVEPAPIVGSAIVEPTPVKPTSTVKPTKTQADSVEKTERVATAANPAKPATLIRNVRSEAGEGFARIIIEADGNAQFKDFVLTNPYRIVLDITGVRNQASSKPLTVGAASVEKVRVGQPSTNVVRVVVDAKSQMPYQVERQGASLVITIGDQLAARNERARAEAEKNPSEAKPVESNLETRTDSAAIKVAGQRIDNDAAKTAQPAKPTTTPTPQVNKPVAPANNASQPGEAVNTLAQAQKPTAGNTDSQTAKQSLAVNNLQPTKNPIADQRPQAQPSIVDSETKAGKPSISESLNAQAKRNTAETRPRVSSQPTGGKTVKELISQPAGAANTVADVRPTAPMPSAAMQQTPARPQSPLALCEPDYRGGLISFDLRAGVDLRDMLRFVSQQYGVNFIVDQSVKQVPVDIRVNDLPWNYVLNSVMRANRLGWVCDQGGIVRIASLDALAQETALEVARLDAESKKVPLITKILHLKYARAAGALGSGVGSSTRSSGLGSGGGGGLIGGGGQGGGLLAIAQKRLSSRGSIEMDPRSNSIIVTDLPEYVQAIEDIVTKLDKPEAQVEIEARIVIASRNFLRDIGVELAGAASGSNGKAGFVGTSPVQFVPGSGLNKSTGSGSGSGTGTGTGSSNPTNLIGPTPTGAFSATAGTVLSLTTGIFGTSVISAALTLQETKGQIRTIASPRVTVTDNQPAEIVNGVQIPVQTVSNNTITTTFVTAALRLQITPQIIEENSEVLIRVVAENNTVNFNLANQFNNGTPGINTQSAESTVRVPDGGTTVMGGINIDNEGHTIVRTPGVSRIPLVGELFKRRTTRRDFDEILFFITPRIIRNDNLVKPKGLEPLDGRVTPTTPPTKVNPPKQ